MGSVLCSLHPKYKPDSRFMTKLKIILLLLISFSISAQEVVKNNNVVSKADQEDTIQFSPIQTNSQGVAIDGFDPVAYFDQDKAVKGSSEYNCEYLNTTWHFSSAENRDKFLSNPEKFVPQYGGYCAHSLTSNKIVYSNPESFVIRDDKLYLYSVERAATKDIDREENIFSKKKDTRDTNWLTYKRSF